MKVLAYIIYLLVMLEIPWVLFSANVGVNTWQWWFIVLGYPIIFWFGCEFGERT